MEYKRPRGVFDIIPFELNEEDEWQGSSLWQALEDVLRRTASDYGFYEIRTPLFEQTELFVRGVGGGSDIVSKEMYSFLDRGDRSMTLRPEGTAPVIRSFVENQLYNSPRLHKFFYIAPMFRYERPQSGRYRQHHQFGAENIGIGKPEQDVELIDMACEIGRRLGLKDLTVQVNSVGDEDSRAAYREALSHFLKPHLQELSLDSQTRFSKNMLRILDSKDEGDQKILENAPVIGDYLTPVCRAHFDQVLSLLGSLNISFRVNSRLVRGLDYYNKTVFEISNGQPGAQNSISGGGRYDGLIRSIGGPDLPSVGFGMGLERLLQTLLKEGAPMPAIPHPFLFIIPIGDKAVKFAFALTCRLRHLRISTEIDLSNKKIQHGFQVANAIKAVYCLVVGEEELHLNRGKLKDMASREQVEVCLDQIEAKLQELNRK